MAFDFPSGSLTVGQIVTGPNGIQFQWDGTKWESLNSAGAFLPLIGGTLTGPGNLTVNGLATLGGGAEVTGVVASNGFAISVDGPVGYGAYARFNGANAADGNGLTFLINNSRRWSIIPCDGEAETGSNAGSNFKINSFDDSGNLLGTPFNIGRAGGGATFTGAGASLNATTAFPSPVLTLNKTASGQYDILRGATNGSRRWELIVGDNTAETGGNAGSNFTLNGFDDTGATNLGQWLVVNRANGAATFTGAGVAVNQIVTITAGGTTNQANLNLNAAPNNYKSINLETNGVSRWAFGCDNGAESGSNAGSNFFVYNYGDGGGGPLGTCFGIMRATGQVICYSGLSTNNSEIYSGSIAVNGTISVSSLNGIYYGGSNGMAFTWSNSFIQAHVDSTNPGSLPYSGTGSGETQFYAMSINNTPLQGAFYYPGGSVVWNANYSDRRLKSGITRATKDALAAIKALKVWECDLKPPIEAAPSQHWNWALIADEVDVIPQAYARGREDGHEKVYDTINELPLIAALVGAVQQLVGQNEALSARIAALEGKVA